MLEHDDKDEQDEQIHQAGAQNFDSFIANFNNQDDPPVYDGCNKGLLSFVVQLLEWKVVGGVTDEVFNSLLKLLRKELKLTRLPLNDYEAKLKLSAFGLSYNRIDTCKCDKMIYYKGTATRTSCA